MTERQVTSAGKKIPNFFLTTGPNRMEVLTESQRNNCIYIFSISYHICNNYIK